MSSITPERIAKLRDLCERATSGPWVRRNEIGDETPEGRFVGPAGGYPACTATGYYGRRAYDNAAFIAEARQAIPDLLDALEEAQNASAKWTLTKDRRPTHVHGGQVDVLFSGPDFSWSIVGTYTHWSDAEVAAGACRWAAYDQQNDKFVDWELGPNEDEPSAWMFKPEFIVAPAKETADVG